MKRSCNLDDLEALVEGGLSPEDAAEVNAHSGECASCGEELKWLRTERELMRRRAAHNPVPPSELADLWSGVQARLEKPRPQRAWWRPLSYSTALAAAAVLAFMMGRQAAEQHTHKTAPVEVTQAPSVRYQPVAVRPVDHDTRQALDDAEEEWRSAAIEMEARYHEERDRHSLRLAGGMGPRELERIDQALARTRRSIAEARVLAGNDVHARAAVLDDYSQYVHSLHVLVSDLEESR